MLLRWILVVVTVVTVALLAAPPPAGAVRVRARLPAAVTTGALVRVPGRVSGRSSVRLERRRGARGWEAVAAGSRFPLRWRAPGRPGVARLRAVALHRGRVVAATPARAVAVSATRVLASSRVESAPAGAGLVRYAGRLSVRPGEFVTAGVGAATPYGLLARVRAVSYDGRGTTLSTEPARLTDAVPAGHIALRGAFASMAAARRAGPQRFASAFACRSGVASLDGSLGVRLLPTFKLDWGLDGLHEAEGVATLRGDAALEVRAGAGASCSLDATIASWDAPPLRFALGPIPVVVVPRTRLAVVGEASVDAGVTAGIQGGLSATAGLRWDGSTHPIGRFRHTFSYSAPATRVSGVLGARLIPSITFLLYGQSGPRFDLSTGLQLDAQSEADPWWTLAAPVELSAALELPGLSSLSIPPLTVFSRTFPLGHAAAALPQDAAPPPPDAPATAAPPADPDSGAGATASAERARIAWDTAATDVDLHVWDPEGHHAWFRDPAAIPGGELSQDDRYGFGPEYFRGGGGGRALTFGLCYFDDSGAGPTHVSVRLTDPDGTTHDSTRTLAREGDHFLIGSSPAGGGFVPPDGWCRP
jgi:hypothetical protein